MINNKVIRSRAPLRIGLAGGGTDLSNYYREYGGIVLNATINLFAYCTIIPQANDMIRFISPDRNQDIIEKSLPKLSLEGDLKLHKAAYNYVVKHFNGGRPLSFIMSTSADAPAGSGLGTSSTMTVAILEAFNRWLELGLDDYQKAQISYFIEREEVGLLGGKQDQYAAVFGGFNLIEFNTDDTVIVNPLRVDKRIINELECSTILFYTGQSRDSAEIIRQQIDNANKNSGNNLDAMHQIKQYAIELKNALLTRDFALFKSIINKGWESKKKTSSAVTNSNIESIVSYVFKHGAEAIKVSGAGGGGFLMILCDPTRRQQLYDALKQLKGVVYPVSFTKSGAESWIV